MAERTPDPATDNFDRPVANPLVDLIDVSGEKQFTPERLRYFKDDARIYLQYGDDSTYSETSQGHKLTPGSDQTLTLRTAEKSAYQVGFDIWTSNSYRVIGGPPDTGDVIGFGYGVLDIGNFNPGNITYDGTAADGYFGYHTADTGLDELELALVQGGTVIDNRRVSRHVGGDVFTIIEQKLNWYSVGPAVFIESFTDVDAYPYDPQRNLVMGAVADDDGKGPNKGSHRQSFGIHQAAGNSGLELEVGSIGIRAPGTPEPQFKAKGHSMDLDNTNTTADTYQVLAAMRIDPDREETKLQFTDLAIISTPGNSVNRTRVLITAVDSGNTNADNETFSVPPEHNEANSVLREVEVAGDAGTPLTGPVEDDADTDASGATTANTMTDPGGYQLARASLTPEGGGTSTSVNALATEGNRELYPGDIALVLVDSNTSGVHEIDMTTEQNS